MPKDLFKVNSEQIFLLWRNFAISLLSLIATQVCTRLLPVYFAPIVAAVMAIALYFFIYSNYYSKYDSCVIIPYTVFLIQLCYSLGIIILNLINVWTVIHIPPEMIFFDGEYIVNLLCAPTGLVVSTIVYLRRKKLQICVDCKLNNGTPLDRGRVGIIYSSESEIQIKNMIKVYVLLTCLTWGYYLFAYIDVNYTNRDLYVFILCAVIVYLLDIIYFGIRYYNLYLDLKERDELISPEEVSGTGVRTYVQFYVICGDSIYLTDHSIDTLRDDDEGDMLGTPFLTKRNMPHIPHSELYSIVSRMTGVNNGTMKFFYGRKLADTAGRRILRFFYFLPGEVENYPQLATKGVWISSDKLKTIYNNMPDRLTSSCLADISRLATILITRKTFTETGERRTKLMHYRPTFNLQEIQESDIDFQDDLWIRVSMFNSDTKFFKLKRWWRSKWRSQQAETSRMR